VFDVVAVGIARLGRGSVVRLFLLVALLGIATTVLLSLDTTAVLLTPVVLALTARLAAQPLAFALLAVWVANTASLLLPVSNLTNLLALDRLHLSAAAFGARMAMPAAVAAVGSVLVVGLRFAGSLRGWYEKPPSFRPDDVPLCFLTAIACLAFAPAVLLGAPAWAAACAAAVPVVLLFLVRRRSAGRWGLAPWRLVLPDRRPVPRGGRRGAPRNRRPAQPADRRRRKRAGRRDRCDDGEPRQQPARLLALERTTRSRTCRRCWSV
jgi:arsenical pump membrane protein